MNNKLNNDFAAENPFQYLKLRWLLVWFLVILIVLSTQFVIIYQVILRKDLDTNSTFFNTFIAPIIILITFAFLIGWVLRQFKLIGIQTKDIIGKIPANYQWLDLIIIAVAELFFSSGLYRIFSYLFAWIFPQYTKNYVEKLANNMSQLSIEAYILRLLIFSLVAAIFYFFLAIILYRFTYKWGQKKALLIFAIFYFIVGLPFLPSMLSTMSRFIIFPFLYLTSRSLIIPICANIIIIFTNICWYLFRVKVINNFYLTNLEDLQNQLWLGILYLILTIPIIITFLRNNWHKLSEPLPYFINQAESKTNI